jgi:hypothetical protein
MQDRVFLTNPRVGGLIVEVSPFAFTSELVLYQFAGGVVTLPNNATSYIVVDKTTMLAGWDSALGDPNKMYLDRYETNHKQITKVVRLHNVPLDGGGAVFGVILTSPTSGESYLLSVDDTAGPGLGVTKLDPL